MSATGWFGPGFVYFAHAPSLELVKIGWSSNPSRRLYQIASDHRCAIEMVGAMRGSRGREEPEQQKLHSHLWFGGEWFLEEAALLAYARSLPPVLPPISAPYRGASSTAIRPRFGGERSRFWHPSRSA